MGINYSTVNNCTLFERVYREILNVSKNILVDYYLKESHMMFGIPQDLFLLTPFILLTNLFLFGWGKVVLDIERLSDFLRGLALYHVRHSFAGYIKESLKRN